jgi:hypothetical protein
MAFAAVWADASARGTHRSKRLPERTGGTPLNEEELRRTGTLVSRCWKYAVDGWFNVYLDRPEAGARAG